MIKPIFISGALLLVGCSTLLTQNDVQRAEQFCAQNGGLLSVQNPVNSNNIKAICKNSMTATFQTGGR